MEQRTMSEIIQQFQPLLKKFEKDNDLIVTSASDKPGSKMGDNYMSIIVRTKITGKRGNGKPYNKTFMVKCFPQNRKTTEFFRSSDLFFIESYVYNEILPVLGTFGPACIYADQQYIIMEDLIEDGYALCERKHFLDFNHCLFTIQKLATLHAKSLAIKLTDPNTFKRLTGPLKEVVFPADDRPAAGTFLESTLKRSLNNVLSLQQTDELKKTIKCIENYDGKYYKEMQKVFAKPKEKFDVLCHGDAWTNNLLFKHDSKGNIIDLKMVDYQIVRHTSPAIDFHYFVYTSARTSVFDKNYDDLIQTYHETLTQELYKSNVPEEQFQDLTLDWFKKELHRYFIYGIVCGFALANVHLVDENDTINMDNVSPDDLVNAQRPIVSKTAERMGQIATHCARVYLRDNK